MFSKTYLISLERQSFHIYSRVEKGFLPVGFPRRHVLKWALSGIIDNKKDMK